jgi:nucleotide-binding universal stress UspA family protein
MHRAGGPPEWGRLSLPRPRDGVDAVGTMADTTSHPAPAPDPIGPLRHVLLATDLSPASTPATEEAMAIARRRGAHLTVLSVVDPRILRLPGGRFLRRVDQEQARVEAEVQELAMRARRAGIPATFLVWHGDPSEVILEAAEAEDVDLVVMGSHGRGRLGRLVLGSTSARVSAESRRRVLVVQS